MLFVGSGSFYPAEMERRWGDGGRWMREEQSKKSKERAVPRNGRLFAVPLLRGQVLFFPPPPVGLFLLVFFLLFVVFLSSRGCG